MTTHYIGTYSEEDIKRGKPQPIIKAIQSEEGFPRLIHVNQRVNKNGDIEVWLSDSRTDNTI